MNPTEWTGKYFEMVSLVKALDDCPYYDDIEVSCQSCPIRNKCITVSAILALPNIE